ncbi:MAG: 2-oxoglutarate ferredoxin oxidoreductase subunit beta [marine bacterium B5-7]|nr:MAG: 2-oxoglutarate ferredoxin oxidoreductase subunit beta [marine bacterium B5-7]
MTTLTRKDFSSDQEVRWCPGCGDYAILATMQRTLPALGIPKENIVFVSGIGCAARFPYYMNTYGFHTIHGRAPTIATGLKITRPELSVWIATGDGDALSIGANHLLHVLRRNVDVKILLFNNEIYGLTKGQYSPTSEKGKITKTSPAGSRDNPINPLAFALTAGATFVARCIDTDAKNLQAVITAAAQHKGAAIIEILQNCNIFNDGAFAEFADKAVRNERVRYLQDTDHDTTNFDAAYLLSQHAYPEHAVPMGILYQAETPTYDATFSSQSEKSGDLKDLLRKGYVWEIK